MTTPIPPRRFVLDDPPAHGDPRLSNVFWIKIDEQDDGCWTWTGRCNKYGYGVHQVRRHTKTAHRLVFEALVGPIPLGLHLDHLCRVRHRVNPAHLEPVTPGDNNRRKGLKESCPKGHPYSGDNLAIDPRGRRRCRQCGKDASKAWHEKNKTT